MTAERLPTHAEMREGYVPLICPHCARHGWHGLQCPVQVRGADLLYRICPCPSSAEAGA